MSATLHDVSIEWSHAHFDATKRWQEAQEKHAAAQEAKLEAKRQARRAATAGPGWRVLERPIVPHEELDRHAKDIWNLAFHGAPWPEGWTVKWAALDAAIGLCLYRERLVLVDERRMRTRTGAELIKTLTHELSHVLHKAEALSGTIHGPRFSDTLERAFAYVDPPAETTAHHAEGTTMDTNAPKATALDPQWEYAALTRDDGTPIVRTAALRSLERFQAAVRTAGGRAPTGPDGQPMAWNKGRGWFPNTPPPTAPGGLRLADAMRQQIRVTQEIRFDKRAHSEPATDLSRRLHAQRQARLAQERAVAAQREAAAIEQYASASEDALAWMARYVAGGRGLGIPPPPNATANTWPWPSPMAPR
jgi:hypothetical protein